MKKIETENAIGVPLCHDITKITKDFKGVLFKKGHIIKEEDIDVLLKLGKKHIFVLDNEKGYIHENEAAFILGNIASDEGIEISDVNEGKVFLYAKYDGLLKINKDNLLKINMIDDLILSTIYNETPVKKGDKVAATKIIPLFIKDEKLEKAKKINKILNVIPFKVKKTVILTTGSEVFSGKIKDGFFDALKPKLDYYNCPIIGHEILDDKTHIIEDRINHYINKGAEIILCTGGMSVDPDDVTPLAIKNVGSEIITYGTPVLPGAMFLMAYLNNVAIIGLPASVMVSKKTIFDIVLPKILVDDKITKKYIASLAEGGLL